MSMIANIGRRGLATWRDAYRRECVVRDAMWVWRMLVAHKRQLLRMGYSLAQQWIYAAYLVDSDLKRMEQNRARRSKGKVIKTGGGHRYESSRF
jgi:hypothetical protein